ncbi:extracellular solute-binding protein [Halosimplex aquaticum]
MTVEFLSTSEISGDVQSQYRSWLNAGRATPDIFRMDSGWTIPFIVRDQLVDLTDHLSDDALSMINEYYFEAPLESARAPANAVGTQAQTDTGTGRGGGPRGELYGVPWQVGFPTIQYRKDLVTEAGFDPDGNNWATEPMTWQRFSEVISQTHQNADVEYGFNWQEPTTSASPAVRSTSS